MLIVAPFALVAPLLIAIPAAPPQPPAFQVREGYTVSVAVAKLDKARFMEFDDKGNLYVSRPSAGDITRYSDPDATGLFQTKTTFAKGFDTVHGLSWHDGWLYFSQTGAIRRAKDTDADGTADTIEEVIGKDQIPSGGGHWWRSLLVTDDAIYTSIGDSGNINDETESERQKIFRFNLDGSGKKLFASGLRNTEKLRFRPGTTELWGCDHGSDWFGKTFGESDSQPITDRNPPCELNHYVQDGFYGHPFIVGDRIPRPEFSKRPDIVLLASRTTAPEWNFGAHWAPNGFCFVSPDIGKDAPGSLTPTPAGDVFVSFHGSWNSSSRVGYAVCRVLFDQGKPYGLLKIVNTLSTDGKVLGRPVDCVQAPDGSILFSDDHSDAVYRIRTSK